EEVGAQHGNHPNQYQQGDQRFLRDQPFLAEPAAAGVESRGVHGVTSCCAWPTAAASSCSWVASRALNSPVMRPSCITRMRSLMPSTSGMSEDNSSMAMPSCLKRLIN